MQSRGNRASVCIFATTAVVISLLAAPAVAETLTGVYSDQEGEFTLEYRDDQHVRMERGSPEEGYMLVRPEGNYMVMKTDEGWRYMGPDTESQSMPGDGLDLDTTGQTATVAGIEGVVYRFNAAAFGPEDEQEMVLTDNPDVERLSRGFMAVIAGAESLQEWLGEIEDIPHKGLLRNSEFELIRIKDEEDLPAAHFELPPDARPIAGGG
ncbi:MAG: hypothetical protein ACQETX_11225 [Pseudomonadota bacterium]